MLMDRSVRRARPLVRRHGGGLIKVEADSMLLRFPDVAAACRSVAALERVMRRERRRLRADESLRFSYGIGWGEVIDLGSDVFGLEVNLASKLGEDLARPGEALLTPAAAAAVARSPGLRLRPHRLVRYGPLTVRVSRLVV
jgi:class 3 adenylate cyclase